MTLAVDSTTVLYMSKRTGKPYVRKAPTDHEPEAVRYAREKAGIKQNVAANELGIKPPHLSQIESGLRNADGAMLNKMAQLYNCPRVVLERKRWVA